MTGQASIIVNEVVVTLRGSGIALVQYLRKSGQLTFEIIETQHHGGNRELLVVKKLGRNIRLCLAIIYAYAHECTVAFRDGSKVDFSVDENKFLIGIDSDAEEAVELIAGPNFMILEENSQKAHC